MRPPLSYDPVTLKALLSVGIVDISCPLRRLSRFRFIEVFTLRTHSAAHFLSCCLFFVFHFIRLVLCCFCFVVVVDSGVVFGLDLFACEVLLSCV